MIQTWLPKSNLRTSINTDKIKYIDGFEVFINGKLVHSELQGNHGYLDSHPDDEHKAEVKKAIEDIIAGEGGRMPAKRDDSPIKLERKRKQEQEEQADKKRQEAEAAKKKKLEAEETRKLEAQLKQKKAEDQQKRQKVAAAAKKKALDKAIKKGSAVTAIKPMANYFQSNFYCKFEVTPQLFSNFPIRTEEYVQAAKGKRKAKPRVKSDRASLTMSESLSETASEPPSPSPRRPAAGKQFDEVQTCQDMLDKREQEERVKLEEAAKAKTGELALPTLTLLAREERRRAGEEVLAPQQDTAERKSARIQHLEFADSSKKHAVVNAESAWPLAALFGVRFDFACCRPPRLEQDAAGDAPTHAVHDTLIGA